MRRTSWPVLRVPGLPHFAPACLPERQLRGHLGRRRRREARRSGIERGWPAIC